MRAVVFASAFILFAVEIKLRLEVVLRSRMLGPSPGRV